MSDTHNDSTLAERDLFEDGADSLLSHAGLETPGSVSGSFRSAGDHIPTAAQTPRTGGVQAGRRRSTSSTRSATAAETLIRRSMSSLGSYDGRFREHGDVFQSGYRSVTACSFGRAKRKICEHDFKQKLERVPQEPIEITRSTSGTKPPPPRGNLSRAERGHWSQKKELPHTRWSQQVQYGHHSPPGSPHAREDIFNRTAHGNQTMHDFFAGRTTFGTDKKWYQRKGGDNGPGPGGVRPALTRIKGGRFNRHRSPHFIEVAQNLGKTLPGPGLYNPQVGTVDQIRGGRFNISKPKTEWQLIEREAREKPSGADTTCNTPWGQNPNPYFPGAGAMPKGGRLVQLSCLLPVPSVSVCVLCAAYFVLQIVVVLTFQLLVQDQHNAQSRGAEE
jgi:hypothetical protein